MLFTLAAAAASSCASSGLNLSYANCRILVMQLVTRKTTITGASTSQFQIPGGDGRYAVSSSHSGAAERMALFIPAVHRRMCDVRTANTVQLRRRRRNIKSPFFRPEFFRYLTTRGFLRTSTSYGRRLVIGVLLGCRISRPSSIGVLGLKPRAVAFFLATPSLFRLSQPLFSASRMRVA